MVMDPNVPIAIIGMSCRFAGDVTDPEKLWQLCAEGRSAWSEIPSSRFSLDGVYHPNGEKSNTTNVKGGHFLTEDVGLFDASFFNLSSETAASIDPQFRLQLESTFEALESAGIPLQKVAGSNTSVFAGAFFKDYHDAHFRDPEMLPRLLLMGVGSAMASNRLSHFFDLRGASMSVDTGCSTTLTALHQACQSLRTGESEMSIVGGANVMLNPDMFVVMSSLTLLSSAGKSYAFDSRASGYGRGEGSATVVLKRLDDALRDGDPIRGIIRGSGINQDGRTETITTPSQEAQAELIRSCYRKAGLDPSQTLYFEAHGTGTPTGDPIEARAIASVFQNKQAGDQPVRIGSVKTNLGHTETASGLASIIKVALALEKGKIPPSINFEKPNEKLRLEEWGLKVPTQLESWPDSLSVRRASVNNFGYGGANAHVILEEYSSFKSSESRQLNGLSNGHTNGHSNELPNGLTNGYANGHTDAHINRLSSVMTNGGTNSITNGLTNGETNGVKGHSQRVQSKVIMLSAKDEQAAQTMASNLHEHLLKFEGEEEDGFSDNLAYTLGQRRSVFPWIAAQPVQNTSGLIKAIEAGKMKPTRTKERPRLGFVFTGQGAQWHAMGRELLHAYPVFKASLEEAERYLKELGAPWSLIEELTRDAETSRVNELTLSMPISVALQVALVQLLRSWGITPTAVTSHSSGEIAAAYAAGALSLQSAMAIVFARGELAADVGRYILSKGGMVAVGLGVKDIGKYLSRVSSGKIMVACINSPTSITASGDVPAVEELEMILKKENIFARRLKVDAAYHSHHMQPIADPYLVWLKKLVKPEERLDNVIYSSPTTGRRMKSAKSIGDPKHWVESLTHPVLFVDAFRNMCFDDSSASAPDVDVVVEVGPHAALSGPIQELLTLPEFKGCEIPYLSCLVRKSSALDTMHALVCDLIRKGYPVNLGAINFPNGRDGVRVLYDLPHYPWNHSTRHWSEPRLNKAHRQRLETPHDLLGSLSLGANLLTPSWRNIIRATDLPWVRDHLVQSNIVYPGAGFICMAIEGALQAVEAGEKRILGYHLRDIDILQALIIPETAEGIEVELSLRPCSDKAIYAKGWKEFQVHSVSEENKWTEHCKGLISVDTVTTGEEQARWSDPISKHVQPRKATDYRMRIDPRDIYGGMRSVGIHHGPIFQNLKSIRANNKQSVSVFAVADTASAMPYLHQHKHVLDPTTLDSIFQAAYTALPGAASKISNPQVPRSIKKLWVAHNISTDIGHRFRAYADISRLDSKSFHTGLVVVNDDDDDDNTKTDPVLKIDSLVCQSIGGSLAKQQEAHENEKFSIVKWAPDISCISPSYLKGQLGCTIDPSEADAIMDLRRVCSYYISDALAAITAADVRQLESHHKKFYVWMKLQAELASSNKLASDSSGWIHDTAERRLAVIDRAIATSVNGEMVCRLGPYITSILRRELTPLELMLENKLLHRYYIEGLKWDRSSRQMGELVKHVTHQNPRAKILEIGGGTGGTTIYSLAAIGTDDSGFGPLAGSYDFTDVSSGFFEAAQEKFKPWKNLVRYKKLDIEQDPVKQGFESGTYDLVVASQVLHATKSMDTTMANVRKLLKPGGKLCIMETTQDQLDLQFAFGLLPGWWLSEEPERKFSPSLSIDMWDRVLQRTGFRGVETEVHDCESEELYSFSVIMTTADPGPSAFDSDVVLVTKATLPLDPWLHEARVSIAGITGTMPTVEYLHSANVDGRICILLDEVDHPILNRLDSALFESIKTICTRCKGLLWVTRGGAVDSENPNLNLNVGFLRSLRAEYSGKRLAALDLDPKHSWGNESAKRITEVFQRVFEYSTDDAVKDFEFADRERVIQIPRYHKDISRNDATFADSASQPVAKLEPFYQHRRPLRLAIGSPGLLDTLAFDDDPSSNEDLHPDSLEVEPKAFGVNFRDVMVAMGQVRGEAMGFECAGIINRVGVGAASRGFKIGDRVTTLLQGHYSNLVRMHWTSAVHIPDGMSFEIAATLPMSYTTAYVSLYDIARLQKRESVLIHAATGGFGQAAIVLAKHVGAEIFVTVGTELKRDFVIKKYGIEPDHIFFSRDASFAEGVLSMTGGRGVDVVLNTLAGALLQESFNCIAPFGRFVEVGKRDLELNSSLEMGAFSRAVTFSHIDLLMLGEHKGHQIHRVMKDIIRLYEEKAIEPVDPVTVYPLSDIEKTFRLMQAGKHMGKIVISVKPDDLVPVLPQTPSARFRPNASYLIVGGLGGIGRSICHWMAGRGAKNLIVCSRSANAQEKAGPFATEMEKLGCKIKAIGCDISDESELAKALAMCTQEMPPIRGVIQGAMVLQDSILEQMTVEDYYVATRPKVQGSWNLHEQLSGHELDFFIMLSSLAGIVGYASQCNYSAGGTFQDALARYRTAKGLPGVAIDLGVVKSVGYVAENDGTAERLKKTGHTVLSEDDVLKAVESAIISPPATQLMLGLNTGPGPHWEESPMARDMRFASLRYRQSASNAVSTSKAATSDLGGQIAGASTFDEAVEAVVKGITKKLVDIFMIAEAEVSSSMALSDYGVDSLVAVELRNMLALRAGAETSIFDIMQSTSIGALSKVVASKSSHIDPCLLEV